MDSQYLDIVSTLEELDFTHVVWVPDSTMGLWERQLVNSKSLRLVRVCREGEAWPLAGGLLLGGQNPIVLMQCTGFFESGDALRNVVHDMQLPVFAIIGVRNALNPRSNDSAKLLAAPVVSAWGLDVATIDDPEDRPKLRQHYEHCLAADRAGIVLLAE